MSSTDTSANVIPETLEAQQSLHWPARALALRWVAVYLVFAGVVLTAGGRVWLAVAHLALLSLLVWSTASRRPRAALIGDFAPLVIASAIAYGEVPSIIAILGTVYHDTAIQRWEQALFGMQPAHLLASLLPNVVLSEVLHGGYVAFYLATFLPPLLLYLRGELEGFAETVLTLTVTWLLCCALFVLYPVQGPRYLWSSPLGVPDGPFRELSRALLAAGSARGAAFPSLHMAASVSQTIMAWRWQTPAVRWSVLVVTMLVGVGAVYAGYHYATDILAGAVVGTLTAAWTSRWCGRSRLRLSQEMP